MVLVRHDLEVNLIRPNQPFAGMLEVDRNPISEHRLDLTDPPLRRLWVANQRPGQQVKRQFDFAMTVFSTSRSPIL